MTTADFILPDDSLSAEPQNVSNHRENQVLAKACLNNSWAISPVSSRCEFLLNLYAERDSFDAEAVTSLSCKLDSAFEELIDALDSSKAEDIPMLSIMNVFNVLIKNSIMVPVYYAQPLLLSLVNFYRVQLNSEKLGAFYRKHATDVLNAISGFCVKNYAARKKTKVYYAMFSNKINASQLYLSCDTNALKRELDKKI